MRGSGRGGCDFPIDPALDASRADVWWRPEFDAELLWLVRSERAAASALRAPRRLSRDEAWWVMGAGQGKVRLMLKPMTAGDDAAPGLAAMVPIDTSLAHQLRALGRLRRILEGATTFADAISPQRRARYRSILRALDGRAAGAAYRDIAGILYGQRRVAAEPWKTSSLRDATLRLVRDGRRLVEGDYRRLLGLGAHA